MFEALKNFAMILLRPAPLYKFDNFFEGTKNESIRVQRDQ